MAVSSSKFDFVNFRCSLETYITAVYSVVSYQIVYNSKSHICNFETCCFTIILESAFRIRTCKYLVKIVNVKLLYANNRVNISNVCSSTYYNYTSPHELHLRRQQLSKDTTTYRGQVIMELKIPEKRKRDATYKKYLPASV